MIVAPLHRYFSPAHLVEVMAEMRWRGAPVLRAHFDATSGAWFAREGTHRLRAAHLLGLTPVLVPIPWWRTRSALERARFAAMEYGYTFAVVSSPQTGPAQDPRQDAPGTRETSGHPAPGLDALRDPARAGERQRGLGLGGGR